MQFRLVFLDRLKSFDLHILCAENVLELIAFRTASFRRGERLVLVERWIEIDEINAVGIDVFSTSKLSCKKIERLAMLHVVIGLDCLGCTLRVQ